MAESAISTVLGSVGNRAVQETKFLCGVTVEVGFLKDELMRLQAYVKDADNKWRSGNARVAIFVSQIRAAAYEAQNVIESVDYMEKRNRLKNGFMGAISRYARLPTDLITLHKVGVAIQRVRRKLGEIFASAENLKIDMDDTIIVEHEFSQDYGLVMKDDVVMVGFEDEHREIVDKLVDNKKVLSAVSIVAMGGAGKTTLAKKVYMSSIVRQHFDVVAWVTVSQTFKGIDLLKDIMKQIVKDRDEIILVDQMNEYDVGEKISKFLMKNRYLVVLDDVWETDTWDQLNKTVIAFPDVANGSRLLLTTRKLDVANHVEMSTHVHALKHLDEEKSWDLFRSKAFPSYKRSVMCDVDVFEKLGRKLARKCDGLPLALAVLGGYLSKNLNTQSWSEVLLGWPSTKNVYMMRDILARSYKDLPNNHLKSCLLYLAAFPEDYVIDVHILITLWIAEGFIPQEPKHELEETARKYVAELAQRSLVQVTDISRAHGWIQEIRVHDILHDWCIEEAKKDGFIHVKDKTSGQVGAPSTDIMVSYRSSYQDFTGRSLQATPDLRALFGYRFSRIFLPKLRFLRVLHIENSSLRDFSSAIGGCILLRCLRLINCYHVTLPSSIGQLLYLQTIDMRNTKSVVPKSIWDIPSLRHVHLCDRFSPPRGMHRIELETFSLHLNDANDCKWVTLDKLKFLGQMTQLRTVWLLTYSWEVPLEIISIFANMPHLVDFRIRNVKSFYKLPQTHHFPQSLQRFSFLAYAISTDPMPMLEKLPCLVVLGVKGYVGRTMSCSARGFPRLQNLELSDFYTEEWKIEIGTMPKLSHLGLTRFSKMKKIPAGLLHLPSLNHVELIRTPLSCYTDDTLEKLQLKGCEVIDK